MAAKPPARAPFDARGYRFRWLDELTALGGIGDAFTPPLVLIDPPGEV